MLAEKERTLAISKTITNDTNEAVSQQNIFDRMHYEKSFIEKKSLK